MHRRVARQLRAPWRGRGRGAVGVVSMVVGMLLGLSSALPAAAQEPLAATRSVLLWTAEPPGRAAFDLSLALAGDGRAVDVRMPAELVDEPGFSAAAALADTGGNVQRSTTWSEAGDAVRVELPAGSSAGAVEIWVELTLGSEVVRTPPVPLDGLRSTADATMGRRAWTGVPSPSALDPSSPGSTPATDVPGSSTAGGDDDGGGGSDGSDDGDGRLVAIPSQPSLSVDEFAVTVRFGDSPPRRLDDRDVRMVSDVVSFHRPTSTGHPSGFDTVLRVRIDESTGAVELLEDGVRSGAGVVPLLSVGLVGAATEVRIDRKALESASGVVLGDALVGLERTVDVDGGDRLDFGGISAPLSQRASLSVAVVDEQRSLTPFVLGGLGLAVLGVVLYSAYRQSMFAEVRRRRREDEAPGF